MEHVCSPYRIGLSYQLIVGGSGYGDQITMVSYLVRLLTWKERGGEMLIKMSLLITWYHIRKLIRDKRNTRLIIPGHTFQWESIRV